MGSVLELRVIKVRKNRRLGIPARLFLRNTKIDGQECPAYRSVIASSSGAALSRKSVGDRGG
jgi:hypothetical protein